MSAVFTTWGFQTHSAGATVPDQTQDRNRPQASRQTSTAVLPTLLAVLPPLLAVLPALRLVLLALLAVLLVLLAILPPLLAVLVAPSSPSSSCHASAFPGTAGPWRTRNK